VIQTVLNGLLLGGMYTALALGLALAFGVMRLVNLAHGELLMGGAYMVLFVIATLGLDIDPFLALLLVAPVLFAIAYVVQRSLLTPLLGHGLEPPLVGTFGIALVLQALFVVAYTGDPKSLPAAYATSGIDLLGQNFRVIYVIGFVVGVGMVAATQLGLTRTEIGRALRAASADAATATTMGINVRHVYGLAFGVSVLMAAVGGTLIGIAFTMTPTGATSYLIKGFAVVVLGGLGSIPGALAGGLLVGLAESLGAEAFGGVYRDLVVYVLLVVILAVRPNGLFGRPAVAA
jgi:branched-chain amino acid transport system permease protein